jgi:hypothetical protein
VQHLRELGWIEGRTVAIEVRWAEGRPERFAEIAAEFVRLKVDVIVTVGGAVLAAKQATSVIPIVFAAAADPLGSGMVASLARPGGNVTGLSIQATDLAGKRIELLREVVPGLRRLAIMADVGYPAAVMEMGEVQTAARILDLEVAALEIRRADDIASAFEARRGTLYPCHSARKHQPHPHQHLGARRPTADNAPLSGTRRSGRSDVLWTKLPGPVPTRRRLCRQDSARGEAGRPSSRAADQIRTGDQLGHGKSSRPHHALNGARPRRRADRVEMLFAGVHESANGMARPCSAA